MQSFHQVNVFSHSSLLGNPLAVVKCTEEPSEEVMAQFAKWTNLSETTFMLPPKSKDADYHVRIWTPTGELPFAGHPTLGTAHVWLDGCEAQPSQLVQECGVGLVTVRKLNNWLFFKAPPCHFRPMDPMDRQMILEAMGLEEDAVLDTMVLENGPVFHAVLLKNANLVTAAAPEWGKFPRIHGCGLCGFGPDGLEVRMVVADRKIEDPITGSLNAALAMWLRSNGTVKGSYTAHQGRSIGRDGTVLIEMEGPDVWVGGQVQTVVKGHVNI